MVRARWFGGSSNELDFLLTDVKNTEQILLSCTKRPGRTIRITFSDYPPVTTILRRSYTTASVNIITRNNAYSVFPAQTIICYKLYALRALDNAFGSHLRELSDYGWINRDLVWPDLPLDARPRIRDGYRRIGNRFS